MQISRVTRIAPIVIGIAAILPLAATGIATARSAPPSIGRAADFAAEHCFGLFFSQVRNNCPELQFFEVPLVTDNVGAKVVTVSVFTGNAMTNQVCCDAVATDQHVTVQSRSSRLCTNLAGNQVLTLTGVQVPSSGRMYVGCSVQPGGVINTVSWNA